VRIEIIVVASCKGRVKQEAESGNDPLRVVAMWNKDKMLCSG